MESPFIHDWLFEHADAPARGAGGRPRRHERLSYGELAARVEALAGAPGRRAGSGRGDRVLVALPNPPATVVASLAVQRAGRDRRRGEPGVERRRSSAGSWRSSGVRQAVVWGRDARTWGRGGRRGAAGAALGGARRPAARAAAGRPGRHPAHARCSRTAASIPARLAVPPAPRAAALSRRPAGAHPLHLRQHRAGHAGWSRPSATSTPTPAPSWSTWGSTRATGRSSCCRSTTATAAACCRPTCWPAVRCTSTTASPSRGWCWRPSAPRAAPASRACRSSSRSSGVRWTSPPCPSRACAT